MGATEQGIERVVPPKEAAYMLGVSTSTLWVLAVEEGFPDRIQMTERRCGWMRSDLMDFIENRRLKGSVL